MSFNLNRVSIAGNLTRDPEVKFLPNDRAVAKFGLAINRRFKGPDGQQQEETTFLDCEAWGRPAELVGQYLVKGSGVYVDGRLKQDTWEDKATGEKRTKLKVVAESVQFVGRRGDARGEDGSAQPPPVAAPRRPEAPVAAPKPLDEEPPF